MSDERNNETNEMPGEPADDDVVGVVEESFPQPDEAAAAPSEPAEPVSSETTQERPAAVAAPPVPQSFPPPRRLVRRPEGKVVAGVCTGFAAYFGLDPVMVRVAVVLVVLFTGFFPGVIAYVVAALVMPMAAEGDPVPPAPPRGDFNINLWLGVGAIIVGAVVLFHNVWDFRGGIFWGLLLVGVGVALWGRELAPRSDRPNPPNTPNTPVPPTSPSPASGAITTPLPPTPPVPPLPPRSAAAASSAPAPSPARREPSMLGRAVVGAAALAIGIALLLDNTNTLDVTPKGVVAMLLLVVGLGLFIGTWFGRARWLIIPGVVLACLLALLATLPDWRFGDGAGERLFQPQALSQVRDEYRLGAGELLIDLSAVDFEGETRNVEAKVGFGELIVVVPDHINVEVDTQVGAGEIDLFHRVQGGLGINQDDSFTGRRREGTLELDAQVGFGEVTLRRANDIGDKGTGRLEEFRRGRIDIGRDGGLPRISIDTDSSDDEAPTPTGASR